MKKTNRLVNEKGESFNTGDFVTLTIFKTNFLFPTPFTGEIIALTDDVVTLLVTSKTSDVENNEIIVTLEEILSVEKAEGEQ
jgi:hypothetical protein